MSTFIYITDQYSEIYACSIMSHNLTDQYWFKDNQFKVDDLKQILMPGGRGKGSRPGYSLRHHRGNLYIKDPVRAGTIHAKLFAEKAPKQCQRCKDDAGIYDIMPLDYHLFYKETGEVFTPFDPLWTSGNLFVDIRQHDQPEDSPLTPKWLCKKCWNLVEDVYVTRSMFHNYHWEAYSRSRHEPDKRRIFTDRRITVPGIQFYFSVNPDAPDRRQAPRRASDLILLHSREPALEEVS